MKKMKYALVAAVLSVAVASPALAGSDAGIPQVLQDKKIERVHTSGFVGVSEFRPAVGDASENGVGTVVKQSGKQAVSGYVVKNTVQPAVGDVSENGIPAVLR